MKFIITMKTPDALDTITATINDSASEIESERERAAFISYQQQLAKKTTSKYFKYDEYLTVEIDTENRTCTVLQN